jgi:hypothetical protein
MLKKLPKQPQLEFKTVLTSFINIIELKESQAQRIANKFAAQILSSSGLDESEWLGMEKSTCNSLLLNYFGYGCPYKRATT